MTTRALLNKVLRGLRQYSLLIDDSTTSVSDDYILTLLQFLNEAKEECEENWPWMALRQTITVTLDTRSSGEYTLTSAADADVDTNDRSQLLYENVTIHGSMESFRNTDRSLPQVFDVTDSSEERLREITQEKMERYHFQDNDESGQPVYFALYHSADSLKLKIWPISDAAYTLKLRIFIPQAELSDTDITTELSIPSRPVWLKALLKANAERGEELGRPDSELAQAYLDALAVATAREMTKADSTVYLED